jgi:hypothetical protein
VLTGEVAVRARDILTQVAIEQEIEIITGALLNHIVMFGPDVPQADRPSNFIKVWSYGTISILSLVTVMFVYLTYLS